MKDMLALLKSRRSIRQYKNEQIQDDELREVLDAGKYAPSSMGQQPCLFIVVQNPLIKDNIARLNSQHMGLESDPFHGAPTVVIVLADKLKGAPVEAGSLAIGNMLNAAHASGLGGCWIQMYHSIFEMEEGKKLIEEWGHEGDYQCIGACILGYPDGEPPVAAPRRPNTVRVIK